MQYQSSILTSKYKTIQAYLFRTIPGILSTYVQYCPVIRKHDILCSQVRCRDKDSSSRFVDHPTHILSSVVDDASDLSML